MNEIDFIDVCRDLNSSIIKLNQEKSDNSNHYNIKNSTISIIIDIDVILESQGFIETNDAELKYLFHTLFILANYIKNYSSKLNKYKSIMSKLIVDDSNNDDILANACNLYMLAHSLLDYSYQKALITTERILNLDKKNKLLYKK